MVTSPPPQMEPRTLRAWVDDVSDNGTVVVQLSIAGPDLSENIMTVPVTLTRDSEGKWQAGPTPVDSIGPTDIGLLGARLGQGRLGAAYKLLGAVATEAMTVFEARGDLDGVEAGVELVGSNE